VESAPRGAPLIIRSLSSSRVGAHKYQSSSLTLEAKANRWIKRDKSRLLALPTKSVNRLALLQSAFLAEAHFPCGLGARGVATPAPARPCSPPGKVSSGSFVTSIVTSAVKNDAHLKKETTVRTEFGGAHDCGAFAGGLIEGKTLKSAHLNLSTLHLAGNRDYFALHLE
jgi:hypothetical protein